MKKYIPLLTLLAISSLVIHSCSKKEAGCTDATATNYDPKAVENDGSCVYCYEPTNPACVNYDPCHAQDYVSANFDAFELLGLLADADTFIITTDKFLNNVIKFEAQEADANYTWYIGTETLHTKSIVRSFLDENLIGQTIAVTLVVEKAPNLSCNPNDDGRDSLTRYFEVVDNCGSLLADTFVGVWEEAPQDTFELAIVVYNDVFGTLCNEIKFWNFNKQQVELKDGNSNLTYHYLRTDEATPSFPPPNPSFQIWHETKFGFTGVVHADKKTVEFEYYIDYYVPAPPYTYQHHHFIGVKKQ